MYLKVNIFTNTGIVTQSFPQIQILLRRFREQCFIFFCSERNHRRFATQRQLSCEEKGKARPECDLTPWPCDCHSTNFCNLSKIFGPSKKNQLFLSLDHLQHVIENLFTKRKELINKTKTTRRNETEKRQKTPKQLAIAN